MNLENSMRYTLSILDHHLNELEVMLERNDGREWAAYLFTSRSKTSRELRFIVKELRVLEESEIESNSRTHVSIKSESYVKAAVTATRRHLTLFLVHNHPTGVASFSKQDDIEEKELLRTMRLRNANAQLGSLLVTKSSNVLSLKARIRPNQNSCADINRIRAIGKRFHIFDLYKGQSIPTWTDRQVRAFGPDNQGLLKNLHIGVVGAGGTGSMICEQLIRMGVGEITVIDPQDLEATNVTRVYGASLKDVGLSKVSLVKRSARRIGLGTVIHPYKGSIYSQKVIGRLKSCDLVFGCSDDHYGRVLLNRIAVWYYIPVIDMAVGIESEENKIHAITGRVNLLLPGTPCLRCGGRIDPEIARAEMLKYINVHDGYAPELGTPDPSVIMFTSSVASRAMCVFMQLITGYMGDEVRITEIRDLYHDNLVGKGATPSVEGCYCMDQRKWGLGDEKPFLGLSW